MRIFAFETPRAAGLLFALNATTHAIFGVAALAGVSLLTGNEPPLYAYPAAVVAAWLPDVDNPRSRLGNGLSRTKVPVLDVISRPISWALRITSFTLFRTVGHRTLTHSLLGVALFAVLISPVAPLFPELFLALLTGYISHLFADALNMRGVPLMWPVKWTFRLLPRGVKSGGVTELLVAFVVAVAAGFEVYALHLAGAFSSGVL